MFLAPPLKTTLNEGVELNVRSSETECKETDKDEETEQKKGHTTTACLEIVLLPEVWQMTDQQ